MVKNLSANAGDVRDASFPGIKSSVFELICGRPTPQAQKRRHFRPFEMKQFKCALQVGETMVTR